MKVHREKGDGNDKLSFALRSLKNKVAKAGWVRKKFYPAPDNEMTTAQVAQITEFGDPAKHIPPRPVMRPAIIENENKWRRIAQIECKKIFQGKQTGTGLMEIIGLEAAGNIRKNITLLESPPLSPVTIARRLEKRANKTAVGLLTKPLIDTGVFLNSCTNTVENTKK